MFSFMPSPMPLDLPQFSSVPFYTDGYCTADVLRPKRRKTSHGASGSTCKTAKLSPLTFELRKLDCHREAVTITKELSAKKVHRRIYKEIQQIKERLYRPTYNMVQDVYGNQFYVEESANDQEITDEAISQLDLQELGHTIAQEEFRNYDIELNRRSDGLIIANRKNHHELEIDLGYDIHSIQLAECRMEQTDSPSQKPKFHALLTLIVKRQSRDPTPKSHKHKSKSKHNPKPTLLQKPHLEDVEDIEFTIYKESLRQQSHSSPIIGDAYDTIHQTINT